MELKKKIWFAVFFGQFGYAVDLETVMYAAKEIENRNSHIKFVICGVGEKLNVYKQIVGESKNVLFPGWVNRKQIAALGKIAHVGLLAYRKSKNYEWSMPNKFCEYLALELALVIQPNGMMEEMATQYNCGVHYDDKDELVSLLLKMENDRNKTAQMQVNARKLYDESFRADVVYFLLAKRLIQIVGENK